MAFRYLIAAAAYLALSFPLHAELKTCKDVTDSPESSLKSAELEAIQKDGLRMAALAVARHLHQGLKDDGVDEPLTAVLEYYERVLVPTREEAEQAIDFMHKESNGNLSVAYKTFCHSDSTQLYALYDRFFKFYLERRTQD